MPAQSFLAKDGLRYGILGSAVSLAVAFPLANGNYSPTAHTDAARMGFYADRTGGAEAVVTNVLGTDLLSVGILGVTSPVQVRAAGIMAAEATFVYWNGTAFQNGASAMAPYALSPFSTALSLNAGGSDAGYAFYQTSSADGVLLTGVIGIAAPDAFVSPATEYTEMYFLANDFPAGVLVEVLRLTGRDKQILGHLGPQPLIKPTYSWGEDTGTGMTLVSSGIIAFVTSVNERLRITDNAIIGTNALQITGGVAAAIPSGVGLDQPNSTTSRLIGWGPDPATVATVQIFGTSSNASIFSPFFEINASEDIYHGFVKSAEKVRQVAGSWSTQS